MLSVSLFHSSVLAQTISPEQFTAWILAAETRALSENWSEFDLGQRRAVVESFLHRKITVDSVLSERLEIDLERMAKSSKPLLRGSGFYADELARAIALANPERANWARARFNFVVWRELQKKEPFTHLLLELDRRVDGRVSLSAVLTLQELEIQVAPLNHRQAYALAEGGFDRVSFQLLPAKHQVSFIEYALQLRQRALDKEFYLQSLPSADYKEIRTLPAHPEALAQAFSDGQPAIEELKLTQAQLLRPERLEYAYRLLIILNTLGAKPETLEGLRPSPELTQAWFTHYPKRVEAFFRQLRNEARGRDFEWLLRPLAFEMNEMADSGGFSLLQSCFIGSGFLQSESLQKILFSESMSQAFAYQVLDYAKSGKKIDFEVARLLRETNRFFIKNLNEEQKTALELAFKRIAQKRDLKGLGFEGILTLPSSGPFDCGTAMNGP